jgi:quinol monooxygenase YgiN
MPNPRIEQVANYMSINIITQFKTKAGRAKDLIGLISTVLPESLDHDGCVEVCIRQNQDEPNDIISVQKWQSRRHYESYRDWRAKQGVTAAIEEFLTDPITVRYFDDVPMQRTSPTAPAQGAPVERLAVPGHTNTPEVPKLGSKDSPGG